MNADGWGVGFYAGARPDAGPLAVQPAAVGRPVVRLGGPGDLRRLRAGRGPLGHRGHAGRRDRRRAVPVRALAAVAQRRRGPGRARPASRQRSRCATPRSWPPTCSTSAPSGSASSSPTLGQRDPAARLNLLLTDGQRILATRWNDTLSVLRTDDGVVVASEPYDDDPRWADVPDHHLVDVTADAVTITDLEN